jgi:hypothetical protein
MKKSIKVGGGMKIKRSATITDNAQVKSDLRQVKYAVDQGLLDSIFTLKTMDIDGEGKLRKRNLTITELDEQIKNTRGEKTESIEFAIYQMDLFSRYLKKNVHAGTHGYSADMILNFIGTPELYKLVEIILEHTEQGKKEFVPGKYNNVYGGKQTLLDVIVITLENKYHLQKLKDQLR